MLTNLSSTVHLVYISFDRARIFAHDRLKLKKQEKFNYYNDSIFFMKNWTKTPIMIAYTTIKEFDEDHNYDNQIL